MTGGDKGTCTKGFCLSCSLYVFHADIYEDVKRLSEAGATCFGFLIASNKGITNGLKKKKENKDQDLKCLKYEKKKKKG